MNIQYFNTLVEENEENCSSFVALVPTYSHTLMKWQSGSGAQAKPLTMASINARNSANTKPYNALAVYQPLKYIRERERRRDRA